MKKYVGCVLSLLLLPQIGCGMMSFKNVANSGSEKQLEALAEQNYTDEELEELFEQRKKDSDVIIEHRKEITRRRTVYEYITVTFKSGKKYDINLNIGSSTNNDIKIEDYGVFEAKVDKPQFSCFPRKLSRKINILDQIHLIWDGFRLTILDTSYDGSLAIDALHIQIVGLVKCNQFYIKSGIPDEKLTGCKGNGSIKIWNGSFTNWGNIAVSDEFTIFSKKIRNIGYVGSKILQNNFPTFEDIQNFYINHSAIMFPEYVLNVGKIDVNNLMLADVSLSSLGSITANRVAQNGDEYFIRLGHDKDYEERSAKVWKEWTNKQYGPNWMEFQTQIAQLNTSKLSMNTNQSAEAENLEVFENATDVETAASSKTMP